MRKLILILSFIIITSLIVSCGNEIKTSEHVTFDTEQLALKLSTDVTFDDELIRLQEDAVSLVYNFGGSSTVVYAGSGATPEIIIIVECTDSGEADNAVAKIKTYIDDQIKLFADYNPSQLPKLETAVCSAYGRYAICAVSPDSTAVQSVIESSKISG
ncbi:MAG: DUF4358 domain-containing protein [Eubacteriales bacterium]